MPFEELALLPWHQISKRADMCRKDMLSVLPESDQSVRSHASPKSVVWSQACSSSVVQGLVPGNATLFMLHTQHGQAFKRIRAPSNGDRQQSGLGSLPPTTFTALL